MGVKVSFVIPCGNRYHLLQETLDSIVALDYDCEDIDVLVVAQGDDDALASIQYSHTSNPVPELTVMLVNPQGTISRSRNIGADATRGDYLAFIDADVELSKNWLNEMLATLEQGPHILAAAVQRCDSDAPLTERVRTAIVRITKDSLVGSTTGQNLLVRRADFERVGGFPEQLMTCEDVYFTQALSQHGTLMLTSSADFRHLGEDMTFAQLFKKEIWRGSSNLAALEGRKIPLREYPSYIVPFFQLFLACIFVVALVTGKWLLLAATILLSMAFPIAYSYRVYSRSDTRVSMFDALRFYYIYFLARAIGMLQGIGKMIGKAFAGRDNPDSVKRSV